MSRRHLAAPTAALVALCVAAPAIAAPAPGNTTGPSSSTAPYLVRSVNGVTLTSLLTAGDAVGGYAMAGTPDGMGAWDNGDGTFTMLVNHEFATGQGGPRSHGNTSGSFVSRWVVDKGSLKVISGRDQITSLVLAGGVGSRDLNRLCSADLGEVSAFYDAASGLGTRDRIFLNGEETTGGRAFGNVVTGADNGTSYELTALGKAAWEDIAANPATGVDTVAVGQSDGGTQGVYVYHGTKQATGTPVEKAGLTNGTSLAIAVAGMTAEDPSTSYTAGPKRFTMAATGTAFARPEDGAWDTLNPDVYYFATTASMTGHSRIWKVTFDDATKPELGGSIEVLLEGPADNTPASAGPKMMDNLTVNERGQLLIQEDPGGNDYVSGIYQLDPKSGGLRRVARYDERQFAPGGSQFITNDEETSAIIPAPFLGAGQYLFTAQVHKAVAGPQVEMGQLDVLHVPAGQKVR